MTLEQPPRLKQTDEFGSLLRAAEPSRVTPERLAANAAGIKARITTVAALALWKLLVPLGLLVLLLIPLVGKLGGGGGPPAPVNQPTATAAIPSADAGVDVASIAEPDALVAVAEAPPIDAAPEPRKRPPVRERVVVPVDAGIEVPVDAPPPTSELPEQIDLYEKARAAGQAGHLARGIDLVTELLRRFPATPLRAEAELTRADLLARADRVAEAVPAFEALIAEAAHRGRRGELLRTLGELHRRAGDCPRAVEAYTRALAERLSQRDRADVERRRDRCASQPR